MNLPDSQTVSASPLATDPPRPRSRFWAVVIQFAVAWIVYILALGPLYWQWYAGKYVSGPTVVAALYEPLWQLCGLCPPLARFVNWYVSWWIL